MAKRASNVFTVFEDTDGICVVPSKWLSPNKRRCKWPKHFKYAQINKAIVKEKDADNNWDVVTVKQIFTTTSTYEAATAKAKVAEFITDVDDEEELKKSRSQRKRSTFSSSLSSTDTDEEIFKQKKSRKKVVLTRFPTPPKASNNLQIDLTTKDDFMTSVSDNSIALSVPYTVQPVQTCNNVGINGRNENPVLSNEEKNQLLSNNNDNISKNVMTYKFLTSDEKLDYLCESNALIMKKLNRILFENSNIKTKYNDTLGTDETRSMEERKESKESLINKYFPLKNMNAVLEFEKLLKNNTFTTCEVAKTLLKRGGKKLEGFLNHIMQDLFVEEVAVQYNYKGQGERKKNAFKDLLLKECVFKAAHLFSINATDEAIKKQISIWLAGATLRLKRKTIKLVDKENKRD